MVETGLEERPAPKAHVHSVMISINLVCQRSVTLKTGHRLPTKSPIGNWVEVPGGHEMSLPTSLIVLDIFASPVFFED